jgi:hypothetical protein
MENANRNTDFLQNRSACRTTLVLSVLVFLFYFSVQLLIKDVYRIAFVGALFELLSLPMLVLLVLIPLFCILQLFRLRDARGKNYLVLSLVLIAATILLLLGTP